MFRNLGGLGCCFGFWIRAFLLDRGLESGPALLVLLLHLLAKTFRQLIWDTMNQRGNSHV